MNYTIKIIKHCGLLTGYYVHKSGGWHIELPQKDQAYTINNIYQLLNMLVTAHKQHGCIFDVIELGN